MHWLLRYCVAGFLLWTSCAHFRVAAFEPAAPWTAPHGTSFPYSNLENQLEKLAQVQASPYNWISVVTMTGKVKRFVLNCVYSLQKYGGHPHYIVATFDDVSLAVCKQLNLPCLNASSFSSHAIEDGDHNFGSYHAVEMWWAKQRITRTLLMKGYNVHGSDVDVVYFRNFNLSYERIFKYNRADAIFAAEESGPGEPDNGESYINMMNAGVYALQSNNRTVDLMNKWLEGAGRDMDQAWLNKINTYGYIFCDSHATCRSVQRHKKAAVYRHKHFFPGNSCIQGTLSPEPCDTRRLYLHFLCVGGWQPKIDSWTNLNLWFVDDNLQPMWQDGGGPGGPHAFLPCAVQEAWGDVFDRVN